MFIQVLQIIVAEREGCLLVPDLLDGIAGKPELKSDSIHPNAGAWMP